ncbi:glycoside hydrolase family 3 protein [Gandjariella thermophila]|uniref:Beta-N-acetylhexosaminidase n=1 Tax=Gandjariella thermophila TaxID=1931992 RepID=A0A4D4J0V3_9PSEU|nr:glycoside hydrolase family 3 N-terminal domain-containing protein [Gandjariella thermophila]GDY30255.1 beta-N-acetylhexosaminidase [Gandjariella thermophila]
MNQRLHRLASGVLLPGFAGTRAPAWLARRIEAGLGGVVLFGRNVVDDAQVAALTAELRAARDGVLVAIDEEGGDVTRLDARRGSAVPGSYALGAVDDADLTRAVAAGIGARLAGCGITVNLAPCADLSLTLDDPIIGVRSFGADPALAARHVAAFVAGVQSTGVASCAKHFPGHGAATADSHTELPELPRTPAQLRDTELVPFRAAVRAGVRAVMTGHLVVPEWGPEPATLNPCAIGVLRDEIGFTGTVITDALDMKAVSGSAGMADGAVRALVAGVDGLCVGGEFTEEATVTWLADALVAAVVAGQLPEDRLAEAAKRVADLGAAPAAVSGHDPELGRLAAERALRVRGRLDLPRPPLVVDLVVPPTIAVGDVPWGLGAHLAELIPDVEVLRTERASAEQVASAAAGRPVIVVTRDAHRHPAARDLVESLASIGLNLVHLETGVPGPDLGATARIDTHGGARVCLRAAAERVAAAVRSEQPISEGT